MLIVLIALAALSFIACIGGAVWWVVSTGQIRTRSGPEAGAEIMADLGEDEAGAGGGVGYGASKQVFKGTGVKAAGAAETTFGDLKRQLAAGERRAALPPLVTLVGLLATVLFGSLALFIGIEDRLIAALIAVIGLFTVARLAYSFVKA